MEIIYSYMCDDSHLWSVTREHDEPEEEAHTFCPHGHEAITCESAEPADRVQILLRPAALRSEFTVLLGRGGKYWLLLLDREGNEIARSKQTYEWDPLMKLIPLFREKDTETALKWWKRRNP